MHDYPNARNRERDFLLDMVTLEKGFRVLDIQAAGGYLSDAVYRRLDGCVECVCVEPCEELRGRLSPEYTVCSDPVESIVSVTPGSIDVAVGLAGLHHSSSFQGTLTSVYGALKHGSECAICDVEEGSPVARWLNEFVDRHNPAGHKGTFLSPGQLSEELSLAGFSDVSEQRVSVPWVFPSENDLVTFFIGLFGLQAESDFTARAVAEYFTIQHTGNGVEVDWSLIYGKGRKLCC